eukprot:CAMPEP_0181314532 /NCGR_PEP_ID=MMETSP1101-20121128/14874_1 /TAXON_ID=46948 /ORGANISM="Rhodomonas abbreviata, Strain Caron Lab Isolate" /LENGTH=74 /DNA_ID=CAMNT_0023421643 /DNA_START=339 /DNA_END=563 /DNA_ORIENTATION=-
MLFKVVPRFVSLGQERYPDRLDEMESYGVYSPPYVAAPMSFPDRWSVEDQYEPYSVAAPIVRYPDRSGGPNDLY